MKHLYTFKLSHGPLGEETSSIIELKADDEALRVGRMVLEHAAAAREKPNGLTVVISREDSEEPRWLGAWCWDGAARWIT